MQIGLKFYWEIKKMKACHTFRRPLPLSNQIITTFYTQEHHMKTLKVGHLRRLFRPNLFKHCQKYSSISPTNYLSPSYVYRNVTYKLHFTGFLYLINMFTYT